MRWRLHLLVAWTAWLACLGVPSFACSCASNPACDQVKAHDGMFLGTVLAEKPEILIQHASTFFGRRRVFTIRVSESFSASLRVGDNVDVETGLGGGDCGYPFSVGKSYLVDAYRNRGTLTTSICSATAPEDAAVNILSELRTAAAGGAIPALSGIVKRTQNGRPPEALSGIRVTLTANDGSQHQTVTDAGGTYTYDRLPAGGYTLAAALPRDLLTYQAAHQQPQWVFIPPNSETPATCHVDVTASPRNEIEGTVINKTGHPLAASVEVYSTESRWKWSAMQTQPVTHNGRFHMFFLPAGEYKIAVHQKSGSADHWWFYPAGQDYYDAGMVRVNEGETTGGLRLVLTPGSLR